MIRNPNHRRIAGWINIVIFAVAVVVIFGCQKSGSVYEIEVKNPHAEKDATVYKIGMNEIFDIDGTDYSASIIRFEPDFTIDIDTKEVASRSQDLNNPAVLLEILENGEKVTEQWVFRKTMPHMSRDLPISFALLTVDGEAGEASSVPAGMGSGMPPDHGMPAGHGMPAESETPEPDSSEAPAEGR